jgi:hypothetical protein
MFQKVVLLSVFVGIAGIPCFTKAPVCVAGEQELSGPIAKDGDVELVRIEEERARRADAVKKVAWETKLKVAIRVFGLSKRSSDTAVILFRFLTLDPVRDNRGKLLSKKATIIGDTEIQGLGDKVYSDITEEIARTGILEMKGRRGTEVELLFGGPKRKATRIKRLRGKLEIMDVEPKKIVVRRIVTKTGTVTNAALKDIKIKTSYQAARKDFKIEIEGKVDRLWSWQLTRNGAEWGAKLASSESVGKTNGGIEFTRGFERDIPKDVDLVLEVLVPVQRRVVSFDLKDIKLP